MSRAVGLLALILPGSAVPQWRITSTPKQLRRLGVTVASSHTNINDADCVVGGFDPENPLKLYVGGPCSKLNMTDPENPQPLAGFRYVIMETLEVQLTKGEDEAEFRMINNMTQHAQDKDSHAEVGVSGQFAFSSSDYRSAALFVSTTSYLSKSNFNFNKNSFVIGKKANGEYDRLDVCVAKCCETPGTTGCACSNGCPTDQNISVVAGTFKYSILAAAFDNSDASYVEGASGNGWAKVVDSYGSGTPKNVEGANIDVYQTIDLSAMGGGTVTITPPAGGGDAITYANMNECGKDSCQLYNVSSLAVTAGSGWGGIYEFPLTYGTGTWSSDYTTTPTSTKRVQIHCVKPTAKWLAHEEFEIDGEKATEQNIQAKMDSGDLKIVFLRYRFDVTGIQATANSGFLMVYDPTVKNDPEVMKAGTSASGAIRNLPLTVAAVAAIIAVMTSM